MKPTHVLTPTDVTKHLSEEVERRFQLTFLALVMTQAAHSIEEYVGRLYEVFAPARFVSGLISSDPQQGFIILNVALVLFGLWCFFWPVRQRWRAAVALVWAWIAIELLNGIGHPAWSLLRGGYTPGVATAPLLLVLALALVHQLRSHRNVASAAV